MFYSTFLVIALMTYFLETGPHSSKSSLKEHYPILKCYYMVPEKVYK